MDSCNIKVAIKVRPLNYKEQLDDKVYWKVESDSVIHIDQITKKKNGEQFFFDRVFCDKSTNYDVFDEIVRPIIDRGVQGFNGTVFAYGQTGSGKTFTMSGDQSNPGIIPLAINYMFNAMNNSTSREYLLRACYLEIYNEKVIDLLEKKNNKNQTKKIEIQKDGLHITPLKAIVCQNSQMVIDLMRIGEKNRSIGETDMNERSSRSHTIFRIILESRNIDDDCDGAYQQSVINLVDLAGSERSSQTQSSMERFKEGCKINSSLTTLGLVIQQLSECPDSSQHVNFRDSKLTRILQTSLGGNSLTAIICTVTLAVEDQTSNTLSFASRAKKIKNTAKVNENVTDETLLKRYRVQLSKLNKELEGIKQNQFENDEVNEIKYKYQEEKRTNEELKERIMRLQNNMITSAHIDQPSNKKGYQRRRTWGGKLDNTFSSNSILETIEEDVNMHRPSVPSNFGKQNKEFKTPLESFEWDLIREEDRSAVTESSESINKENIEHNFSPPSNIPFNVCETPKKVLRERVNNYKNMFEMSMKENNELREFTTLEKQMFYNNNEQLKELTNLSKEVENLQTEKNESEKMIEKLKHSIQLVENEKRDIEVIMEVQKNMHDKRETELLATIQETREELKIKEDQLKKTILSDNFMAEKQEEIKRLEMKIKEMYQLNNTYINEIDSLKLQLLNKDQQLNLEGSKQCSLLNELSLLKNDAAEVKSVPCAIKFLADKGYFTLRKCEILELDQLLEHIRNTVEQLQLENQSLIDENNNLKLITNEFNIQMKNIKKENYELSLKLNSIEENIKSIIKDFSGSSEINVENSDTKSLIDFAVTHFEENTNKIDILSNKNLILEEKLSLSNTKLNEIKSFVFYNLDCILQSISIMEVESSTEMEKFKKQLSETIEENIFLKSNIQAFDKLTFECVDIIEKVKTNHLKIIDLQEELAICSAFKIELQVQVEELNGLNVNLNKLIENQTKVENEIKDGQDVKSNKFNSDHSKMNEMQLIIKENEIKSDSIVGMNQLRTELETVKSNLEDKSNIIVTLEKTNLELLSKYSDLEKCYKSNTRCIDEKDEIEKQLQNKSVINANGLQDALEKLKEMNIKLELNDSEIDKLKTSLNFVKLELNEKLKLIEMENSKFEVTQNEKLKEINEPNSINSTLTVKFDNENDIYSELLIKTKALENATSQINVLQLSIEEMKINTNSYVTVIERLNHELNTIKFELEEKIKLVDQLKNNKSEELMGNNLNLDRISELDEVITKLKSELEEKLNNEKILNNELQIVTVELDGAILKVDEVKSLINNLNINNISYISIVEQLNYELKCIKSTLNEKNEFIFELENTNLELATKSKKSDDQLNKIITDLKVNLEDKIKVENELRDELISKTNELEYAKVQNNKFEIMVESMENELKSNVLLLEECKSDLAMKSNLLFKLENVNVELTIKYDKINQTMLNNVKDNEQNYLDIQNQLHLVIQEKSLIQTDLNLISQKFIEISKHHDETKNNLENKIQQQVLNYHILYTEFVNLSCDIESLLKHQSIKESNLREEILLKSTELELLQKQVLESSLQQEYDRLEEEYMLRSRECDEARQKIINFESVLSKNEESEKILRNNLESKCIALEEYKKNVEFLFSRNDSFQIRVNDFEDNVLVGLNEEFDLMKSELSKKTEYEKILIEEKANLECDLNRLQEKFSNITKEMELSEERCEDLASIINVLVIEIKDANSVKQSLECCLNEAEHELLKSGDYCENLKLELYSLQRELENACINTECVEKELKNLKFKLNENIDKKDLNGGDVRNKLIDPLVDYVHDIKLKLTELNSAIISGNQSEKQFRSKVMSVEENSLPHDETLKINCGSQFDSTDIDIGLEIENLHKVLKEKNDLINNLQTSKNNMEKNIVELQCQVKKQFDENNKYIDDIALMENDLKEKTYSVRNLNEELNQLKLLNDKLKEINNEPQDQIIKLSDVNEKLISDITLMENDLKEKTSLISNLKNELNELKIQHNKLEEHNQANKEQIYYSYDIDSELRNGKRNIINEINLLEPGKITGVLTDHNLSNLLDMFVSLIMTKEQQIVTDLVNEHNKIKQLYEDQIKQFQEDIKKGKEWQEQVENDNEKLGLELENLKSQKHNFPNRELKIKELTEKVLEAENVSFNYLNELQELKTQLSKTSEQNYQLLSDEFEVFKTNSEVSIQDLKNKLENLTKQYNESLSMYKDQKNCCFSLEDKIEKIQSECDYLKSIIEKKDEDIKNLLEGFKSKTNEYEVLIEKYSLQKEEIKIDHEKKINELEFDLSNIKHQMYCTEKLLKEIKKNNELLLEENSLNLSKIKHMQENNNSAVQIVELEGDSEITKVDKTKLESLEKELLVKSSELENLETDLKLKTIKLEETETQCTKLVHALEVHKLKNNELEKQLESFYQTLKIKDDKIEDYQIKLKLNEDSLIEINNITDKLRKILKCNDSISTLYDNVCSLMIKCKNLEEEIEELKQSNADLDNECESMLEEVKNKDDKITELLTQLDELKTNIELLTEEKDFLKNKTEQFKNFNEDVKKLNEEIFGYEQNIYELRKDKGQLIIQHDKELKQLKMELNKVQTKNLELSNEYNKLSETAKTLEKSLKEDIQQLNRCIVDKNAKISTLELFSKTNTDDLKKKNHELENVFKRARDENHMLRREIRRLKEITNVHRVDQCTQTIEEQSLVADHKSMIDRIAKFEKDNKMMKMMLHHRKAKIEELEKLLNERHC
ncbi:centromere-associated protein E-like isoform X2 [Rhopalosiphum padi]|uniref:centromere-associated protein E-like isoform X2 n=1 Tax=Rhopalosiphum padi TaxID=40932 RepID=UPI00298E8201|nr:centromere-associated protein E-like isoform X2 [Rhopalosiphum padi]